LKTKDSKKISRAINQKLDKNVKRNVSRLLEKATMLIESTAKESIQQGVKSGRKYTKRGVTHTASAKGEAPATDTGFLASNIGRYSVKTDSKGRIVATVYSSAPYSKFLEFGTRNMGERPFMLPALEKNTQKIIRDFKKGGLLK
tara:strand:- start:10531 stop:10962 length:432 start_codon:yes stop_codon:yes gene_type:complete